MTDERDVEPDDAASAAPATDRRNNEPLVLVLIGVGVAVLLFAASALPVILSRDDDDAAAQITTSTVEVPTEQASPSGSQAPTPTSTEPAATTDTAVPGSASTTTTIGTSVTSAPTTTPTTTPAADVPESVAVVLGGQIFLEGAVPDEASHDQIVELAAGIFGGDNVIDNYVIDERASDPSLGNIRVDDTVLFAPDSAEISPEFEPLLNQGLALLTIRPASTIVVEGHTDSLGGDQYNLELSQARADAVVQWWVDRGVDPERLTAVGRGEAEPIDSNETREGRERNRRIEVTIENLLVDG